MLRTLGTQAGLEHLRNVLVAFIAACGATSALITGIVKGPPAVGYVCAVGLVFALAMVAVVVRREIVSEREAWQALMVNRQLPRRVANTLDADGIYALGVEREGRAALKELGWEGSRTPPYLRRPEADIKLCRCLRESSGKDGVSLVVLSGPPKAGKSRTLLRNLAEVLPDAWLIRPADAAALAKLVEDGPPPWLGAGPCVLWLNDLEDFAKTPGLSKTNVAQFNRWKRPVLLLCAYKGGGSVEAEQLVPESHEVKLAPSLTDEEVGLLRGHTLYAMAAERIEQEGIAEFMIVAEKFRDALDLNQKCLEGLAVAFAAIDWYRCGLRRPAPADALQAMFGAYIPLPATEKRFDDGLTWAVTTPNPNVPVLRLRQGGYVPYPYATRVETERQRPRDIPDETWKAVLDRVIDGDEFVAVSREATRRGEQEVAHDAYERYLRCVRSERRTGPRHGRSVMPVGSVKFEARAEGRA